MPEQHVNTKELKGLALPPLRTRGGYFASKGKYDVVWGDVLLTLFTPIGSRPGNRSFGSALTRVLFDPSTADQIERIRYIITESITEWCPHVRLKDVRVLVDRKEISITVLFGLVAESHLQSRKVTLRRNHGGAETYAARVA